MTEDILFYCPYCGEEQVIEVSADMLESTHFIQDCDVCCRPIEIRLYRDPEGAVYADVSSEDGDAGY